MMKKQKLALSREIISLLIVLIVLMATASVMIRVIGGQSEPQTATLSLRGSAPPSDDPVFLIESTPDSRYLRSAVGIEYNGTTWRLDKISGQFQNSNIGSKDGGHLPLCTTSLSKSYLDFDRDVLNRAEVINDSRCLALPNNMSDRTYDLSRRITQGMPTPFEKAKAIEEFLRVKYDYKLDYDAAPANWEPNDWFLFESREGICGNFNSAFVILARASGIPARLAAGYYVNPGEGEQQIVYANQAHAWAEVGLSGLGWLAFEAVPP